MSTPPFPAKSANTIKRIGLLFREKVLVPLVLVIVGVVFFDPIRDWWVGPKVYKI